MVTGPASSRRGQLKAGLDDEVADVAFGRLRVAQRPAGPGFNRVQAAGPVAGDQTVQVLAGVAVLRGRSRHRQLLADDLQDRHACSRHGTRLSPMSRLTCRVSAVTYVVNPHTTARHGPVPRHCPGSWPPIWLAAR